MQHHQLHSPSLSSMNTSRYTTYQSLELFSPIGAEETDQHWRRQRRACHPSRVQWLVALFVTTATLVGASVVLKSTSSYPLDHLLDSFISIRMGHGNDKHYSRHDDYDDDDDGNKHFTKIVIIDKHSTSNRHHGGDKKRNQHYHHDTKDDSSDSNDDDKHDDEETIPFRKRAGEIHGFINVNKTCAEAYNTPSFRNFSQLFYALIGVAATQRTKHTYSFDIGPRRGYPLVEYVQYNDTAMTLDVVIVDGFDVFQAFHQVFAFNVADDGKGCRIYRTQYLILADSGPVSWKDMQAAGNEELTAMYKLLGP